MNYVVNELKGLILSPAKPRAILNYVVNELQNLKAGVQVVQAQVSHFLKKQKMPLKHKQEVDVYSVRIKLIEHLILPNRRNTDHADPKSRGGNNTLPNAQNTCQTCNQNKGTMTTGEYLMHLLNRR